MRAEYLSDTPKLSVVVCVVTNATLLQGCLKALYQQVNAPPTEIIVPFHARDAEIRALSSQFPQVRFHPVEQLRTLVEIEGLSREHHDELRAIGLLLAKGEVVALLEDHGWADPNWARSIMEVHGNADRVAVGGAMENGVDKVLNWAVYYSDFGRYQTPFAESPTSYISDANTSYKKSCLEGIKDAWQASFHETTVNKILMDGGATLWLSPKIVVVQHREGLGWLAALQERYVWGRSYAATRTGEVPFVKRVVYLTLSPTLPLLLMKRKTQDVFSKKRHLGKFIKAWPVTFLLSSIWALGEFMGYLTGRQHRLVGRSKSLAG